ncbi:MAG: ABC transporter permease [Bacilli bacterium]|nr:ABC transporter permease [Bacilli bacterium]
MKFWEKPSVKSIASSLTSIIFGLVIGCIILFVVGLVPTKGMTITAGTIADGIELVFFGFMNIGKESSELLFGFNGTSIGNILFKAMPLIMTGLSVALAFKTGLFNIGTPGQYLCSTAVTLILALSIPTEVVPPFLVWIIAFLGGMLAGALAGVIPGVFKAYLNVNEVITCIMMNWISANLVTMLFDKNTGPFKHLLDPSGTKNFAYVFKTTENGVATAKLGLDKIFEGSQVNAGIIIAIIIAIVVYIILNKTTFGYQLKACGSNKHAAKYAGISENRNIIFSMAIAGALAGAGASLYYLSGNTEFAWETYQTLPAAGFNGIPVALLACNNPIGVIFSASFISLLDVNGMQIKYMTSYNEQITSIITAIIVYFSAFSLLFRQVYEGKIKINLKGIFQKNKKATVETVTDKVEKEDK